MLIFERLKAASDSLNIFYVLCNMLFNQSLKLLLIPFNIQIQFPESLTALVPHHMLQVSESDE